MTTENDKIALIDIDGTLADYDGAMRAKLLPTLSDADRFANHHKLIESGDLHECKEPWLEARMRLVKSQPGFWRTLPVIPTGMAVYEALGLLGYRRMILTKGPKRTTEAWTEKVEWCAENVPEAGVMVVRSDEEHGPHKGLVYGKVLFDDFPPYILQWIKHRPRGRVLMLDSIYNQDFEHTQVLRIPRGSEDNILLLCDKLRAFVEG